MNSKSARNSERRTGYGAALTIMWVVATPVWAQSLNREIAHVLATVPQARTQTGVCIVDLRDGSTVFQRGADEPLVPASTMKLFAMSAALDHLGPDFHFETVLATDGTNLIVIGDGDPALGDERLARAREESITAVFDRWADALAARGYTAIAGDLVIDESVFDDERVHPTWEPSDLGKWYAAPVGGLNFNDNCVDITVHPGTSPGAPTRIAVQPPNSLVQIVNRCKTGDGTPILHHPPGTFEYRISGRCGKVWPFGSVAFPDPGLLFADSMRTVFASRGVALHGSIHRARVRNERGAIPESLNVLATHRTPIGDVLQRAGKNSQNLFAECLLKRVGFERARRLGQSHPQGSFALGAAAVETMVAEAGINTANLRVVDGSGLSRENAASPRHLAELLAWAHRQPWGSDLHDSLAVAGVDGSLRRRIKDRPERIHAKTGTMTGVRALAGYVDDGRRPRYAFAILFNGYKGPSTPYKKIQDRICRILADAADETEAGR